MKTFLFPGQGSQFKGMGRSLFIDYPRLTKLASEILGYSIKELCMEDPENKLRLTQYTQPALYVVNALGYFKKRDERSSDLPADFFVGHSLGEYNALLAAEAFDFETGLKLVQKRGDLMSCASEGSMAAILGVTVGTVQQILTNHNLDTIDLANYNTPTEVVISGKTEAIQKAEKIFEREDIKCILLNVSTPFHSRYMQATQKEFTNFLQNFTFQDPKIPVIANSTARPYERGKAAQTASNQITASVLWSESIQYLMKQGEMKFIEIGSKILSKMVREIERAEKLAVT